MAVDLRCPTRRLPAWLPAHAGTWLPAHTSMRLPAHAGRLRKGFCRADTLHCDAVTLCGGTHISKADRPSSHTITRRGKLRRQRQHSTVRAAEAPSPALRSGAAPQHDQQVVAVGWVRLRNAATGARLERSAPWESLTEIAETCGASVSAVKRQLQSAAPRGTCDKMAAQAAISGTRELRKKLMGSGWCAPPMVRTHTDQRRRPRNRQLGGRGAHSPDTPRRFVAASAA